MVGEGRQNAGRMDRETVDVYERRAEEWAAKRPAAHPQRAEDLRSMFAQWATEAEAPTPEEDAAYDAMLRRLDGESGVTMRRVDVTGSE